MRSVLTKSDTLRSHSGRKTTIWSSGVLAATKCHRGTARTIITLAEGVNEDLPTSHSSEFEAELSETQMLYGANVVRAALVAKKRSFRRLFTFGDDPARRSILDLARKLDIDVAEVENRGVLNNFSGNRPHNGFVLECSVPEEVTISCLGPRSQAWQPLLENSNVMLHEQRTTEVMNVNEAATFPVYLLLDEISDPQNIGSIIRTAYFMGVTGIVLSSKNCASLTPAAVKAASGATEFLPMFYTNSSVAFVKQSQKHGWTCVATVSPKEPQSKGRSATLGELSQLNKKGPVVYVFGSESKGLRVLIKRECHRTTTIQGAKHISPIVDSLNVGVSVATILASLAIQS